MKTQYGFWVDTARCIDCYACEVACKQWHGIKAGTVQQRRVVEVTNGTFPDVKRMFISLSCMHCGSPACAVVCPTGAIKKDPVNGIVTVDSAKCIGCHYCFYACPFGVPQYGDDGTMQKCDMCLDRLAEGKVPACAATCTVGALHFGTMEELSKMAQEKTARKLAASTQPSMIISK